MQGTLQGRTPAFIGNVGIAGLATLRVVVAAYVLAATTAIQMGATPLPLQGFAPPDLGPAALAFVSLAALALAFGKAVRTTSLILAAYLTLSAFSHMGLGESPVRPYVFWADVTVIAVVCMLGSLHGTAGGKRDGRNGYRAV